ncbi:unnamed protein product, partial [Musa textilis]
MGFAEESNGLEREGEEFPRYGAGGDFAANAIQIDGNVESLPELEGSR